MRRAAGRYSVPAGPAPRSSRAGPAPRWSGPSARRCARRRPRAGSRRLPRSEGRPDPARACASWTVRERACRSAADRSSSQRPCTTACADHLPGLRQILPRPGSGWPWPPPPLRGSGSRRRDSRLTLTPTFLSLRHSSRPGEPILGKRLLGEIGEDGELGIVPGRRHRDGVPRGRESFLERGDPGSAEGGLDQPGRVNAAGSAGTALLSRSGVVSARGSSLGKLHRRRSLR